MEAALQELRHKLVEHVEKQADGEEEQLYDDKSRSLSLSSTRRQRNKSRKPSTSSAMLDKSIEAWTSLVCAKLLLEEEEEVMAACGSVLEATMDDNVRSLSLNLSKHFSKVMMQRGEVGNGLSRRARAHVHASLMEVLLATNPRKDAETCTRFCDDVDKGLETYLKHSYFEDSSGAVAEGRALELLEARTWSLVPQLKENLLGTSKTRGLEGKRCFGERMSRLCDEMQTELKQNSNLNQLPLDEVKRVVHKCNILCRYISKLLITKFSFVPTVSVQNIAAAMDSYFLFCRKILSSPSATKGSESVDTCRQAAGGLSSLLSLQRALVETTSGSILIWVEPFVKQLNVISKLALSRHLLLVEMEFVRGEVSLIQETMLTMMTWLKSYKAAFALKLKPQVLAAPFVVLIHLCKKLESRRRGKISGERWIEEKWRSDWLARLSKTSFEFLSVVCQCTSLLWPTQEMQAMIGMALIDTCSDLVATTRLLLQEEKVGGTTTTVMRGFQRADLDEMESLCVSGLNALTQMSQCSSSPAFASLRERTISVAREACRFSNSHHLGALTLASDTALQGLRCVLRPKVLRKWDIIGEEERETDRGRFSLLTTGTIPDLFEELFDQHAKARATMATKTENGDATHQQPPKEVATGLAKGSISEAKKGAASLKPIPPAPAASKREREGRPIAKNQESGKVKVQALESPEEPQKPVMPPTKTSMSNYDDLLSDSEGDSLSLDSGMGDD